MLSLSLEPEAGACGGLATHSSMSRQISQAAAGAGHAQLVATAQARRRVRIADHDDDGNSASASDEDMRGDDDVRPADPQIVEQLLPALAPAGAAMYNPLIVTLDRVVAERDRQRAADMTCLYCHGLAIDAVTYDCAHTSCAQCAAYDVMRNLSRQCRVCSSEGACAPIRFVRLAVENLTVRCLNAACTQTYVIGKAGEGERRHVQECVERLVPCPHCNADVVFRALEQHTQECEHRRVTCDLCQADMRAHELVAHKTLPVSKYARPADKACAGWIACPAGCLLETQEQRRKRAESLAERQVERSDARKEQNDAKRHKAAASAASYQTFEEQEAEAEAFVADQRKRIQTLAQKMVAEMPERPLWVLARDAEEHRLDCPSVRTACDRCGRVGRRGNIAEHHRTPECRQAAPSHAAARITALEQRLQALEKAKEKVAASVFGDVRIGEGYRRVYTQFIGYKPSEIADDKELDNAPMPTQEDKEGRAVHGFRPLEFTMLPCKVQRFVKKVNGTNVKFHFIEAQFKATTRERRDWIVAAVALQRKSDDDETTDCVHGFNVEVLSSHPDHVRAVPFTTGGFDSVTRNVELLPVHIFDADASPTLVSMEGNFGVYYQVFCRDPRAPVAAAQ